MHQNNFVDFTGILDIFPRAPFDEFPSHVLSLYPMPVAGFSFRSITTSSPSPFAGKSALPIPKRKVGLSGLAITPLVFGANVFGWTVDEKTAFKLLDGFVAAGHSCIDTADVYSRWAMGHKAGESETVIGKWLKGRVFGASNFTAERLERALAVSAQGGGFPTYKSLRPWLLRG